MAFVCVKYGKQYRDLQPRVTKTFLHAILDPSKPLTSIFGAIHGVIAMGPRAIQLVLVPNIPALTTLLQPKKDDADVSVKEEASQCFQSLAEAAGTFLKFAYENLVEISHIAPKQQVR